MEEKLSALAQRMIEEDERRRRRREEAIFGFCHAYDWDWSKMEAFFGPLERSSSTEQTDYPPPPPADLDALL